MTKIECIAKLNSDADKREKAAPHIEALNALQFDEGPIRNLLFRLTKLASERQIAEIRA